MEESVEEKDLAERLFGKNYTKDLQYLSAPFPLILFCFNGKKGFVGDDLGMSAKACSDFYPMPTDKGICFTKNINIKEVMKTEPAYDNFLSLNLEKSDEYISGGTSNSRQSFVIFTGGHEMYPTLPRTTKKDRNDIQLKVHSTNDLANFFEDNTLTISTPLTLKVYHEYFIDITPHVVQTTDSFKEMDFQQRKCKLSNEILDGSILKKYTMKNCQYECNIEKAGAICHCIPWDFIHNTQAKECDLFGRTCFYNAMEKLSKSNQSHCKECIVKECDYTTYEAIITKENKMDRFKIAGYITGECNGPSFFCSFLLPGNGTKLLDQGLVNAYNGLNSDGFNESRLKMLKKIVIIHLRILKPNVQLIDAKYSISDKFANFGGNFGIFAEITGCSFLGILNFFIILFKLIFSLPCQK